MTSGVAAVTGRRLLLLPDSRAGRGIQPSWPASLPAALRIPIDHCLVSPGIAVVGRQLGPQVGSHHLPVIVDLAVPAGRAE